MRGTHARIIAAAADLRPDIERARERLTNGAGSDLDERLNMLGHALADLPEVWFHEGPCGAWVDYPG